jgi:hypothetical protein
MLDGKANKMSRSRILQVTLCIVNNLSIMYSEHCALCF